MKKRIVSLVLSSALIAGMIFFSPITTLAVYPDKSVTVLCGYPPGGSVDATARAITQAAKKYFPKPMVVVNRPGVEENISLLLRRWCAPSRPWFHQAGSRR